MTRLYALKGTIQHYAWGGHHFIPNLLNVKTTKTENFAEYWLGAHTKSPSTLLTETGEQTLDSFIKKNAIEVLGNTVEKKFGRLPFLFKVLDVKDMLSIQVHPKKSEAEKGFEKENKLGIPLDAPYRNYKDDNHKPEIMVALSEFWLLHGFLPKTKLEEVLKHIPELQPLLSTFYEEGYYGLYKTVMEAPQKECNQTLQPLVDRILPLYKAGSLQKSSPDYWAAKAIATSNDKRNIDKGIYSIYFFNIAKINPGEAIFQDAGIPHAYLEGQNMELMANSDNVLRGGLTQKHVDVQELLKHVVFEETIPNIKSGDLLEDNPERIYKSPAPDFELSQIKLKQSSKYESYAKTAAILIVVEGEATITENDSTLSLKKGDATFLLANSNYSINSDTTSVIYKATTP